MAVSLFILSQLNGLTRRSFAILIQLDFWIVHAQSVAKGVKKNESSGWQNRLLAIFEKSTKFSLVGS